MPPRRNEIQDPSERQAALRARRAEEGLTRREIWLPPEGVEAEAFVRERVGVERVRQLITWVLMQEKKKLEG